MKPLRLLLVDDSPTFLRAMRDFLTAEPTVEEIASCLTGAEAVGFVREQRPHLVLIDVIMPGMNGFESARLLKAVAPSLHIVLLSLHDSPEFRASAREAGADAFIGKAELATALPPLLRQFGELAA